MRRGFWVVLAFAVALVGLPTGRVVAGATGSTAAVGGRQSLTGTVDGVAFRVETPEQWNGTLVLYSHGYYPTSFGVFGFPVANRPETEGWLLEHGYALAASEFRGVTGYQVKHALHDQIALLDWFTEHVGRPKRTVATGQSQGAAIALLLAERNPDRFSGVATVCAAPDPYGLFDAILDVDFAVRTLLAPEQDIDLVRPRDAAASTQALRQAVEQALRTPQGRARLALAASFNNVQGWYSAHQPRPTDLVGQIRAQASWIENAYILGLGPSARVDLEAKAGGNPSSNVGVDYRRQLTRATRTHKGLVRQAYQAAGLDLGADLDRLAAAPRISADPVAAAWMRQFGVPRGNTPVPVVTLHTTGDGGAVPDGEWWFAQQVRRNGHPGRLRQLWVKRGQHCSTNAAEEILGLQTLFHRLDTGHWPDTTPGRLNTAAAAIGPGYQQVTDFGSYPFHSAPMPPAFTRLTRP